MANLNTGQKFLIPTQVDKREEKVCVATDLENHGGMSV